MRTREQERMALALELVTEVASTAKDTETKKTAKKYGAACHTFPPLVRTAGLCQAIAFFETRETPFQSYLKHMEKHLLAAGLLPKGSLRDAAANVDSITEYMLLTREALACALWHKRLAQSELDVDATGEGP